MASWTLKNYPKKFVYLPVYAYEHSGLSLSTRRTFPYNDRWDSWLFGIIAVSKEKLRKENGWKLITKKRREDIEKCLADEIKVLDAYCQGEVYGFIVYDENGTQIDSCWGYYGEYGVRGAIAEAKSVIDSTRELQYLGSRIWPKEA